MIRGNYQYQMCDQEEQGSRARPVPVEESKSCFTVLWEATKRTYSPSILTMLIYLAASAAVIGAMIFDDISIPRLLTGILGMIIYLIAVFSVYFDFQRESLPQPDGDQRLFITHVKKVLFAKTKWHAVITWLATIMVLLTLVAEDEVLRIELFVTFSLMMVVLVLGFLSLRNHEPVPGNDV